MNKYCCLLNGQNFLLNRNGVEAKHGFYQRIIVQAETPEQASRLATTRIWHDSELKSETQNPPDDPPKILLKTIWELDLVNDPDEVDPERFYYREYEWWQLIKRNAEKKRIRKLYEALIENE